MTCAVILLPCSHGYVGRGIWQQQHMISRVRKPPVAADRFRTMSAGAASDMGATLCYVVQRLESTRQPR